MTLERAIMPQSESVGIPRDCGAFSATLLIAVLFPKALSPVAPVVPVSVVPPEATGVPDTRQVTVSPSGTMLPAVHAALPGLIVHVPMETPVGRPATVHVVPAVASAVPMLLHAKVPE